MVRRKRRRRRKQKAHAQNYKHEFPYNYPLINKNQITIEKHTLKIIYTNFHIIIHNENEDENEKFFVARFREELLMKANIGQDIL